MVIDQYFVIRNFFIRYYFAKRQNGPWRVMVSLMSMKKMCTTYGVKTMKLHKYGEPISFERDITIPK